MTLQVRERPSSSGVLGRGRKPLPWRSTPTPLFSPRKPGRPAAGLGKAACRGLLACAALLAAPWPANLPAQVDWRVRMPQATARMTHSMAYDAARRRVVLFGGLLGGNLHGDTWEWDGSHWTQATPAASPTPRAGHGMVYDAARRRVVLFGGEDGSGLLGDTWEWDGGNWAQATPATSPPPRRNHALAFDLTRGRVVLFAGWGGGWGPPLNDTWEWDGSDWTRATPATSPSPRDGHAMAFDLARRRTVLFGGWPMAGAGNDTWEWDGANWTQAVPTASPPVRSNHAMAYDAGRRRVVLFGGEGLGGRPSGDTWEWDGSNWTQAQPAASPTARSGHAMAFDAARARVVLFGGVAPERRQLGDTWEWNGSNWTQVLPHAPTMARSGHAMAFDAARRRIVLFGGGEDVGMFQRVPLRNDTWELMGTGSVYEPFGTGCGGTAGVPGLRSDLRPWIGEPFRLFLWDLPPNQPGGVLVGISRTAWGGVPLPLDLGPAGMPGCSLHVSGQFLGALPPSATGSLTWGFTLPNDRALVGGAFFNQAFFLDPPANAAGLIATNAGRGIVGG